MRKSTKEGSNIKIKSFFNVLKTDLHRAFFSRNFIIGAAAMLVILFFGSIGMVNEAGSGKPAVMGFEHTYAFNNIIDLTFSASTFAYAACFASEWQNRFSSLVVIRSNPKNYALSKCVATGLSGGASLVIGTILFIIYTCLVSKTILPPVDGNISYGDLAMFGDLVEMDKPVLFFSAYLYVIFLQGMFFSVLGLTASACFPNKYVAYAAPFTLGFTISQIVNTLGMPDWFDPSRLAMAKLYRFTTTEALLIATGMFLLYTGICSVLFVRRVKRRIENG